MLRAEGGAGCRGPDAVPCSSLAGPPGTLVSVMPDDSKKTMTLRDLLESKHGPAALQRMKANPGLTLGEALKEIREEEQEEDAEEDGPARSGTPGGSPRRHGS